MRTFKSLLLIGLVAGFAAPVLASSKSDATSNRTDDRIEELTMLYQTFKDADITAPKWLEDELFDPQGGDGGAGREGGETTATAFPIASLPFTDTGNTSDNINDYGNAHYAGTPICTQVGS